MKYPIERHTGSYNLSYRTGGIKYLVIHYTGAQTPDYPHARDNCRYFAGENRNASADFFIDNESICQYNPDPERYYTWEVGDGRGKYGITNANSVGIEVCQKGDNPFTEAEIARVADLAGYLMAKYGIPSERVVRHYDASRKSCPEYYAKRDSEWKQLHARITGAWIDEKVSEIMGMDCIIQPNGKGRLDVLIGGTLHSAAHPDEITAANMVAKEVTGKELPVVTLGTQDAPWATRFYDLMSRGVDDPR